ncbi:NADH-quinone oxidoreductase subunit H [Malaciobacter molluscorum LMG 25693]|uniref:NADH-quinone oxidoreductase subunit H n=1 Tax=Malaciobacter molluscorum LMG 25693 TaxID=870501 RepID=A0A2G1DHY2_9BACT|nr:complex I subunit 1 family protein [Malaciobacter molluscorum]AXX93299.1 NADH:quinone oxidoreductase I, membrane subunit H [Malaciobacter molluscorum LMG 25693]PHO17956.1 NADH-quinone oxidoreductase subunit H [Malaciobacter molluscorum LMG 25693]RXJ95182.1 NADH-quinone oxidoreductase subunit H [Malaciobacter molluscorum]
MTTVSIIAIIINITISLTLATGMTPVLVWWERRVAGFIQDRAGPNRCNIGPIRLGGLIQSIADMLKLVFKEDFTPSHIKYKFFFSLAPIILFFCVFLTFGVIPFADNLVIDGQSIMMQALPIQLGVMWFLAYAGLSTYGIILGGYSSGSKFGILSSIRATAQVISYEAAMALSVVSMLLTYGSIHLGDIVASQGDTLLGFIPSWGVFMQPLAALIFIVTAFAETNRTPFDIAEGESEIVAGYHTEYSAMKFGLFQVGELAAMCAASAIIVTLFFGGYQIPWLDTQTLKDNIDYVMIAIMIIVPLKIFFLTKWMKKNNNWGDSNNIRSKETAILTKLFWAIAIIIVALFAWFLSTGLSTNGVAITVAVLQVLTFIVKFLLVALVFIWIRWTLLRFRYDQLQMLGWKVLLPLSLLNIVITATYIVVTGS